MSGYPEGHVDAPSYADDLRYTKVNSFINVLIGLYMSLIPQLTSYADDLDDLR